VSAGAVEAYREHVRSKVGGGKKSLPDDLFRNVQAFLAEWVKAHCAYSNGEPWNQRDIANTLGVTQNEFGAWMRGDARPGISRLIDLHRATGESLETILGL
jgi:hypothetical protein